jgi:spermidine synthase
MQQKSSDTQWILLLAVFVIATCGLIYELVAGTLASYLLGDSVRQFSTIIGTYLFAMGIGSWLSKYFSDNLITWFIRIELLVGLIGGFSAAILFFVFPQASSFGIILYGLVLLTGMLVGLEIPLLMRILKDKVEFKDLVSKVFTFDYIGALLASLIFPLLLVPQLGLIRTALFFGMLNTGVGWYLAHTLQSEIRNPIRLKSTAIFILFLELLAFVYSNEIMAYSESMLFNDRIVYAKTSPYQRIVLTSNRRELRLFLNGNLQFSTADEYRYHEALVHPALSSLENPKKVLVLGGGDGLAVRELLKYPSIDSILLVDLDPVMTEIFKEQPLLTQINQSALKDPRLRCINSDAFAWIRSSSTEFDAIIADFPDPSNFSIGKLYSNVFYSYLHKLLKKDGLLVIQSTSPFVAPKSFWCIDATLQAAGFKTIPYHNYVPSFGEWGYIMAMHHTDHNWFTALPEKLRFVNRSVIEQMKLFPQDMQSKETPEVNRLNNQALVHYFEKEWSSYLD